VQEYYNYRNAHIDWALFCKYNEHTYNTLNILKENGYKLVLYSDCYWEQILATINILKLNEIFDLILSKENGFDKPTPRAYQYIAEYFGVSPANILGVANDLNKDLLPLKFIGGQTMLVKSEKEISRTIDYISGMKEELFTSSNTI
jgi:FMN phosphatase YigB (HAD superfamily)